MRCPTLLSMPVSVSEHVSIQLIGMQPMVGFACIIKNGIRCRLLLKARGLS